LEERADELLAVLHAAGSEKVAVIAGADGGAVAMMFAATYPERVSALCLYATWARVAQAPDYPIGYPAESVDAMVELVGQSWGTSLTVPLVAPSMVGDDGFAVWLGRVQRLSASPAAAKRFFRTAWETDVRALLPTIRVPTIVVHRSGDQVVPIAWGRYVAEHIPGARFVELAGADHLWFVGDTDPFDEVEHVVTGVRPVPDLDRVLATVMFTDIVGSTDMASELGDRQWRHLLDSHDAAVDRQLERFAGRKIKSTGDGVLGIFDGPGRAIRCACAIRDSVRSLGVDIRAGLHTGEIERRADDVAGVAVHIAARVLALATPGEVLVSGAIPPLVAGSGIEFADRGEHDLKGVPGIWRLYSVDG
jgi:class 3 adenylate cyclase